MFSFLGLPAAIRLTAQADLQGKGVSRSGQPLRTFPHIWRRNVTWNWTREREVERGPHPALFSSRFLGAGRRVREVF